jgi:polyphosphate glucokinase
MNALVVDVGGTHVKILVSGQKEARRFASGPTLTDKQMVSEVQKLAGDWRYDLVSIGYPVAGSEGPPDCGTTQLRPGLGWVQL